MLPMKRPKCNWYSARFVSAKGIVQMLHAVIQTSTRADIEIVGRGAGVNEIFFDPLWKFLFHPLPL